MSLKKSLKTLINQIDVLFPKPPIKPCKNIKRLNADYVLTTQQLEGRKINVTNYFLKKNSPNIY